jgi:hypothetical protein
VCYWWTNGAPTTNSYDLGNLTEGAFSTTVADLVPGTAYSYQCYASNQYGESWAAVSNFTTLAGLYAATNGNGSDGLTWATAFTNLQTAVDAAQPGQTIFLAAHTFSIATNGAMTNQIVISKTGLTIRGGYAGSGYTLTNAATVIQRAANCTNRIVYINGSTNVTLDNLTIQNGYVIDAGGGVLIANSRNVTVSRATIQNNQVYSQQGIFNAYGGGICVTNSSALLSNVLFQGNSIYGFGGDRRGLPFHGAYEFG